MARSCAEVRVAVRLVPLGVVASGQGLHDVVQEAHSGEAEDPVVEEAQVDASKPHQIQRAVQQNWPSNRDYLYGQHTIN